MVPIHQMSLKNYAICEVPHKARSRNSPNCVSDGTAWFPVNQFLGAEMSKITACAIISGLTLCAGQTATGPPALALDRYVELTNNTRMAIVEIYVSQVGAGRWEIDLLGNDILAPKSSIMVNIDNRAGCRFDFMTVFDDGAAQIRRNVNVCVEKYAISYR
jgi:hypothetical protein